MVFNQHDLIPYTFQYLDLLSLNQCSKVNFIWLFHSYNINSLYHFNFNTIFKDIQRNAKWHQLPAKNLHMRIWQRLINIRSIVFLNSRELPRNFKKESQQVNKYTNTLGNQFVTNFPLLHVQNIEKIKALFEYYDNRDLTVWKIMSNNTVAGHGMNRNKIISLDIEYLNFHPDKDKNADFIGSVCNEYDLPIIAASNVNKIKLERIFPRMKITNKCKQLTLKNLYIGIKEIFLLRMNNCDLSGIEYLSIENFYCSSILSFAKQLTGLQKMHVVFCGHTDVHNNFFDLCKELKQILWQNKCQFSLCMDQRLLFCHNRNDQTKLDAKKNLENVVPFFAENGLPITEIQLSVLMTTGLWLNDVVLNLFKHVQYDNIYADLWKSIQLFKLHIFSCEESDKIDHEHGIIFQLIKILSQQQYEIKWLNMHHIYLEYYSLGINQTDAVIQLIKILKYKSLSTLHAQDESIFFKFCIHALWNTTSSVLDERQYFKKIRLLFAVIKDFLVNHRTPIDFTFYMVIRPEELEESCICEWLLPDMNDMRTIKQLIEKDCINPFLSIFSSGTNKDYSIPKGNKYCCLLKKPEIEIGYRKPCKVNKSEKYLPTLFYCSVRNAVCNNCKCQPIY